MLVNFWKKFNQKKMANKKAKVAVDQLIWILLGVIALVVIITIIMVLSGRGEGLLDFLNDLLRFGTK